MTASHLRQDCLSSDHFICAKTRAESACVESTWPPPTRCRPARMDQPCTTAAHGRPRADPFRTVERHCAAMARPHRLASAPSVSARLAAQDSPYPAEPRLWLARVESTRLAGAAVRVFCGVRPSSSPVQSAQQTAGCEPCRILRTVARHSVNIQQFSCS